MEGFIDRLCIVAEIVMFLVAITSSLVIIAACSEMITYRLQKRFEIDMERKLKTKKGDEDGK